jgi:hypothetical protein
MGRWSLAVCVPLGCRPLAAPGQWLQPFSPSCDQCTLLCPHSDIDTGRGNLPVGTAALIRKKFQTLFGDGGKVCVWLIPLIISRFGAQSTWCVD